MSNQQLIKSAHVWALALVNVDSGFAGHDPQPAGNQDGQDPNVDRFIELLACHCIPSLLSSKLASLPNYDHGRGPVGP